MVNFQFIRKDVVGVCVYFGSNQTLAMYVLF